eukprot:TRINITY_DN11761_c0_g3_i2.p2 TRINITY_DN11761_c0_g3~~TRINITY_DN11761_c0_g3_i2.p2  ORF type:complete len:223 (-),score=47.15 TRINITY_DN11761_c0_g3_i2:1103-1771(-)
MEKEKIIRALCSKVYNDYDQGLKFTILLNNRKEYAVCGTNRENRSRVIDDNFVRAVEYEYAVKYLEHLGIESTQKNIGIILSMAPFKDCRVAPAWESSSDVPSAFHIYPAQGKKADKQKLQVKSARNWSGAMTARVPKRVLPVLKSLRKTQRKREENEFEVKDSSGIPKLTLEVIRKKYLYPFCIDSTCHLTSNSTEAKRAGGQHRSHQFNCNATPTRFLAC